MKISPARQGDAEALAELARTLIERDLPHTWDANRIGTLIRHPDCAVIVARDGRRLAGFASMQFMDEHAHLVLLAVRGAYRQRGIGRSLVEWLEACARTAGIFDVHLEVRETNTGGAAFYERLGYRRDRVAAGYYSGVEGAIRMSSDLRRHAAPM